jgi:hypothetical protein
MRQLLLNILLMSSFFSFAQDKAPELPRFSIRGNVGIPKVASSKAFRHSFSGVMTVDVNVDYKIFSNFFVGLGYSYTYYKSQKYFRDRNINTNLQTHNGYLKLGYDHFFSDRGFTTISLNTGYNNNAYQGIVYKHDSLVGKNPTQFNNSFIEPMIGLYFIVDPNFAIGGHLSYYYNFSTFNPTYPGFDKWLTYDKISNRWNTSLITLGFGFYYGLSRDK